jgi:homeobox-leucine zipper protein
VRNIGEISYNNERMPFGSFSQPRLVTTPALAKSMFNSPGLSLALVSEILFCFCLCVLGILKILLVLLLLCLFLLLTLLMKKMQQTNIDGQEDVNRSMHENYEQNGLRRSREEEQSRSGSDNLDGVSGDEQDADDKPPRKKRYHRHTPQQIQELEAYFSFTILCFLRFI